MCLIVHRPEGVPLPGGVLLSGIADNPHGWGIMRPGRRGIAIDRGLSPESFWRALGKVGSSPCTIHFRLATHGQIDLANTHPFPLVGNRYALMHNGILATAEVRADRSDTWHFGEYVLTPILERSPDLFGTETLDDVLAGMIGPSNKLVIMDRDGTTQVINRRRGIDHEGLWLSNAWSLPRTTPATATGHRWTWDDNGEETWFGTDGSRTARKDDVAVQDDRSEWDLWDLDGCSFEEIAQFCRDDPEAVASLIVRAIG